MLARTWRKSYPILLRDSGYMTAFAGKFGFELKQSPSGDKLGLPITDFDSWGGGPGQTSYDTRKNRSMAAYAKMYPHSTLSYGAFGCDFIRTAANSGKPFSLSISFKAPHKPATPDPKFDAVPYNNYQPYATIFDRNTNKQIIFFNYPPSSESSEPNGLASPGVCGSSVDEPAVRSFASIIFSCSWS